MVCVSWISCARTAKKGAESPQPRMELFALCDDELVSVTGGEVVAGQADRRVVDHAVPFGDHVIERLCRVIVACKGEDKTAFGDLDRFVDAVDRAVVEVVAVFADDVSAALRLKDQNIGIAEVF